MNLLRRLAVGGPTRVLVLAACLALAACGDDSPAATPAATGTATSAVPSVAEPDLREELLAMFAEDQAVRTGVAPPGDDRTPQELLASMDEVDARHAARLAEILDAYGWPGWSLVGRDGSTAAWALVQHADVRPALQRRALELLRKAVEAGDASPGDLAYLTDRVRFADGEPQVYGTQWETDASGSLVPRTPIEDPEHVDERRAAAGLQPLEQYLDELREVLTGPPASATG